MYTGDSVEESYKLVHEWSDEDGRKWNTNNKDTNETTNIVYC